MGHLAQASIAVWRQLVQRAATEQGGVISGDNPARYNPSDPIRLWVIQVVIIITMTQVLSLVLARIRQPRVIAEVIGGVILGPTAMGHIPGFTANIFPDASMPMLNLTSTIGLILFLFLVGLEIDARVIKRNVFSSAAVSVAGLLVPLGLGAALGIGIYREFINPTVNFGHFLLFTAVAVGITAFPVLCRILTELKLLDTKVGVVVLAAGVGNDVVGWILLALTVALVNASSGLTALWVLLASAGYTVLLLYPGRWAFVWLARRTGSLDQGSPTAFMMTVTLLVVFISSFYTNIIGVHAIFGAFLAGLIIPHENGFAISLVEKLEDLVSILFLPIYFTLSGLKTNLGLLDNGITWAYTILICAVAFSSKFFTCGAAAKLTGFGWRESGAIGSLMSCKGLVELIVLNIGLQAGILDTRVFSMFVVHALILTFMTTPLVLLFYPNKYRVHEGAASEELSGSNSDMKLSAYPDENLKRRITIVLDRLEQLPAAMTVTQLLKPEYPSSMVDEKRRSRSLPWVAPPINIDALRLIELSARPSAVLKGQESEALLMGDPIVSVFKTFGHLNFMSVSPALSVVNYDEYPTAIAEHAARFGSQMVVIPWSNGSHLVTPDVARADVVNPSNSISYRSAAAQNHIALAVYAEYVRKVFLKSPSDVAVYVDRGMSSQITSRTRRHLLVPFFGGPDDRLALSFAVQLCMNPDVHATVIRICKMDELSPSATIVEPQPTLAAAPSGSPLPTTFHNNLGATDTEYGQYTTQNRVASDAADDLLWDRYAVCCDTRGADVAALSRMRFDIKSSSLPLHTIVDLANNLTSGGQNLIVVVGRSRRMATESHQAELRKIISESGTSIGSSVAKTLGDVGTSMVAMNVNAALLVMQAHVSAS
ncbi:hypothetical protein AX17_002110 [Amanita inopinata Kibby_2008]|nr:hypothetical protein AX17_002110 [Amanita inopinata Kibby_2008]